MTSSGIALLVLTLVCWLLHLVCLSGASGPQASGDAAFGQGISWFFAAVFAALTWLWLGGLLLQAGTRSLMPQPVAIAAAFIYLLAAISTAASFLLLEAAFRNWSIFLPAAIPPVLVFYVIALHQSALRPVFTGPTGLVLWTTVLILALIPLPAFVQKIRADQFRRAHRQAEAEAWKHEQAARNREANLVKLQAMSPTQPLVDWYPLLESESGVRTEAFDALRRIDRRQSDIEEMLSYNIPRAMTLLPDLDLQPTPRLCAASQAFLLNLAKESRVRPKQDPRPYRGADYIDPLMPSLRWLTAHGCNCAEGLAALQAAVATYIESPERNAAIASIAALHAKP